MQRLAEGNHPKNYLVSDLMRSFPYKWSSCSISWKILFAWAFVFSHPMCKLDAHCLGIRVTHVRISVQWYAPLFWFSSKAYLRFVFGCILNKPIIEYQKQIVDWIWGGAVAAPGPNNVYTRYETFRAVLVWQGVRSANRCGRVTGKSIRIFYRCRHWARNLGTPTFCHLSKLGSNEIFQPAHQCGRWLSFCKAREVLPESNCRSAIQTFI